MGAANQVLDMSDIILIVTGIIAGTIARFITLEIDYRQNPSFPSAYFINLVTGFIASALGAIAIPTLLSKNFTAVTFLTLAVQQFREIRKIEFESLGKLEQASYVKRGNAYIDGIAKTYESRNYVSLLVALTTVLTMKTVDAPVPIDVTTGMLAGFLVLFLISRFIKGKNIGDICDVTSGKIEVRGSELYVDDMFITNLLGTDRSRRLFQEEGLAAVIHPKQDIFRLTLDNNGQRQAILFEAVRAFGVKRYKFTRRNFSQGKTVIAFVPVVRDVDRLIEVIKKTPILENSRKVHRIMSSR